MFKKFLSTMLLSTLFVTSANAAVSGRDIADKNLSSDSFASGMQKIHSQEYSKLFGKNVKIDVLKSANKSKVTIKNGSCRDYSMLSLMATDVLSQSEKQTQTYSQGEIDTLTIMTYRVVGSASEAKKKLCK